MKTTISQFKLVESDYSIHNFIKEYKQRIHQQLSSPAKRGPFVSFAQRNSTIKDVNWIHDNRTRFIEQTPNESLQQLHYLSEIGFICCMEYSPNGDHIIVGHSTGLIQMRHGTTGAVQCTLRNVQMPPKPVYALHHSRLENGICYAACTDGAIYRIEIPEIRTQDDPPKFCIRADPALDCLHTQFYNAPGVSVHSTPFVIHRSPALALGVTADETTMIVGYADSSIKVVDKQTQAEIMNFKIHKLRLQFIPKKLQRIHTEQVCALRCHPDRPYCFASASWDNTLRIWDTRCKIGCMMTFEAEDIHADSIDLKRDHCISGSWKPTEALSVWDLVARNRLTIVRAQNRRPDVDGEYLYACRYWNSREFNRKGKYALIGGSGTQCLEVINLHNRYIACSYPTTGSILAVTSYNERIAFGGTSPVFNMVTYHDPKHEKYAKSPRRESCIMDLKGYCDHS